MYKYALLFLLMILTVACSENGENQEETEPNSKTTQGSDMEILASELRSPWDIEVSGDTFYITERAGNIVTWTESEGRVRESVNTKEAVHQQGEGGLLGFELRPDFEESREAFVYHTYQNNGETKNRVIVIRLENEGWEEVDVLLENIPGSRIHNGGRIKIGPDQKLYVTTGDAGNQQTAQQEDSLAGKILRMSLDGSIPDDNPFGNSYVYTSGHRNPQGLAWTEENEMYASEHGSDAHDEINKIEAGNNYGWPEIRGDEEREGMVTPIFHTGTDTWAPSGIAINESKLFVASLRGQALRIMDLKALEPEIVTDDYGRIRDVIIENDALFFITNNTDGRGTPSEDDDRLVRMNLP
ncbi:PQQ-dependent sugar dehydrogenase [Thalassobacillus sp. B23F22_16]|uniref:PQQ-dependent sugar dehydrogenase n=1 Tax=Thalassobacillus sp. B23F22_16 TaxID=3459513 RepID=UPI00373F1D29